MSRPNYPQVELYIECMGLKNLDILSKSDPRVFVYTADPSTTSASPFTLLGKTERIQDNLNPKFTTTFRMEYMFEVEQRLQFIVVDDDEENGTSDDCIGKCVSTLGKIVGQGSEKGLISDLISKRGNIHGQIRVRAVQLSSLQSAISRDEFQFKLCGRSLAKKDFGLFAKSDPYFQIQVMPTTGSTITEPLTVYQSEIIKRDLNPNWNVASINMSKLSTPQCTSIEQVLDLPIRIVVWDWDQFTSHDLIGRVETSLSRLLVMGRDTSSTPLKLVDDKGKFGGNIILQSCSVARSHSFLDYLQLGHCELSLVVSVDFTGSNGDPRLRDSLHYIVPQQPNQAPVLNEYQSAIWTIGNILSSYDHDQMFPSYGFGASLGTRGTSHCFPLTLDTNRVECQGVNGIMQAYHHCVHNVALSGPTNFAPTINAVINKYTRPALASIGRSLKYYVLLIITDGEITDMGDTIRAIRDAANTPLSIVIVGVGSADFSCMKHLDGDDGELGAKRDIVQFVPYRSLSSKGLDALSRETLREIPSQVEKFYKMMKIDPTRYNHQQ